MSDPDPDEARRWQLFARSCMNCGRVNPVWTEVAEMWFCGECEKEHDDQEKINPEEADPEVDPAAEECHDGQNVRPSF